MVPRRPQARADSGLDRRDKLRRIELSRILGVWVRALDDHPDTRRALPNAFLDGHHARPGFLDQADVEVGTRLVGIHQTHLRARARTGAMYERRASRSGTMASAAALLIPNVAAGETTTVTVAPNVPMRLNALMETPVFAIDDFLSEWGWILTVGTNFKPKWISSRGEFRRGAALFDS